MKYNHTNHIHFTDIESFLSFLDNKKIDDKDNLLYMLYELYPDKVYKLVLEYHKKALPLIEYYHKFLLDFNFMCHTAKQIYIEHIEFIKENYPELDNSFKFSRLITKLEKALDQVQIASNTNNNKIFDIRINNPDQLLKDLHTAFNKGKL